MSEFRRERENGSPVRYLRVSGRLSPDGRIELRPSYLSENPRGATDREGSALQIIQYAGERRLLRWGAHVAAVHEDRIGSTAGDVAAAAVRAKVPFHPETDRVVFEYDGAVVEELPVHEHAPVVEGVTVERGRAGWTVEWDAFHPDEATLHYHVRTSGDGGATWRRVAWRLDEPGVRLEPDDLIGGDACLVEVVAYDGVNTTAERIAVPETPPPRLEVTLFSPTAERVSAPVELSAAARLRGRAGFAANEATYTWSVDGEPVATGPFALWTDAAPGSYTVRVEASYEDRVASAETELRVEAPGTDAAAN